VGGQGVARGRHSVLWRDEGGAAAAGDGQLRRRDRRLELEHRVRQQAVDGAPKDGRPRQGGHGAELAGRAQRFAGERAQEADG